MTVARPKLHVILQKEAIVSELIEVVPEFDNGKMSVKGDGTNDY